jgi:ABC-type branched-subunit amino acid transport system ATPase component
MDYIRDLNKQGQTFVVIEHNMDVVMNLCERIVVLDYGEKIAEGTPMKIQNNQKVIEAYFGVEE